MAKPYKKITKSFFLNNYNIVNVLTKKDDVMKYLETYNSKKQAVMFGTRKKENRDSVPNWFKSYSEKTDQKLDLIMSRLDKIDTRLDKIDTRLDNLVSKNNLVE